jgi:hypothetical protein
MTLEECKANVASKELVGERSAAYTISEPRTPIEMRRERRGVVGALTAAGQHAQWAIPIDVVCAVARRDRRAALRSKNNA